MTSEAGATPLGDEDLCLACILHGDRILLQLQARHPLPMIGIDAIAGAEVIFLTGILGSRRERVKTGEGGLNVRTLAAIPLTRVTFSCYV